MEGSIFGCSPMFKNCPQIEKQARCQAKIFLSNLLVQYGISPMELRSEVTSSTCSLEWWCPFCHLVPMCKPSLSFQRRREESDNILTCRALQACLLGLVCSSCLPKINTILKPHSSPFQTVPDCLAFQITRRFCHEVQFLSLQANAICMGAGLWEHVNTVSCSPLQPPFVHQPLER